MIDIVLMPEERVELLKADRRMTQKLEDLSNTRIKVEKGVVVEGDDVVSVLRTKEVLKAFGRGFSFEDALSLLDEECVMDMINLKDFAGKSRKRQVLLKGRVIGTEGRMKELIQRHTNTKVAVYGKTICIIGKWKDVQDAKKAVEMLLSGCQHNTVYKFLEREV